MSQAPGLRLEDYLLWRLQLILVPTPQGLPSMGIAAQEYPGLARIRVALTQFQELLLQCVVVKHRVEELLQAYENNESWMDYHDREMSDLFDDEHVEQIRTTLLKNTPKADRV